MGADWIDPDQVIDLAAALPRIPEPAALDQLGVPQSLVLNLAMRRTLLDGQTSTSQLAESLALGPSLTESVVESLRHSRFLEVQGLEGRDYKLALTELGRSHAMEHMAMCRYAGVTPVSLTDYNAVVRRQHIRPDVHLDSIRRAFGDLVVSDQLLDELGPAIRSNGAIFLYGLPGTGKSAIAERLIRIHDDPILVPHAVEVDGQIITVFDPAIHRPVDTQPSRHDRRWILCRRPSVIVGGELSAWQLNLTFASQSGIYLAPIQMQANNGVLVIDDFGRQLLTPEQLLNRWIVPLDRGIDYLTLDYGVKFEVPCLTKIVFSTNLRPASLADDAFFRRIRAKVEILPLDDEQFDEVLRRAAANTGLVVPPGGAAYLRAASRAHGDGDLRPYLPGAVCELARSISDYESIEAMLDEAMVDRIVSLYFTHDRAMQALEDELV